MEELDQEMEEHLGQVGLSSVTLFEELSETPPTEMKYTGNVPDAPMGKGTPARDPEDWRKYTGAGGDAVRFVDESLPDPTIGTKCQKLLDQLGLRYGAFDFIETPGGEMVFFGSKFQRTIFLD